MKVTRVNVRNFRLLQDVSVFMEDTTTVVVGGNNSGKTSLTELFRRWLSDSMPRFTLEDFSISSYDDFWAALKLFTERQPDDEVQKAVPAVDTEIWINYEIVNGDVAVLSEFIIDLDPDVHEIHVLLRYQLDVGKIENFFEGCVYIDSAESKNEFLKTIKDRVSRFFTASLVAIDPTDEPNRKVLDLASLRNVLQGGFVSAQRGFDDTTHREKDVLGKILQRLMLTASEETATTTEHQIVAELDNVVERMQQQLDNNFNSRLNRLLPALETMGYPGLSDPHLHTETRLDLQRLLESHTKIRYATENGIGLPETYNGLGSRNLIYILFQIYEFFKAFQSKPNTQGLQLIFIEEPEAHLHPQMQEVFVRQLSETVRLFEEGLNEGRPWTVQFVLSTHSTHLANQAPFESIRYFFAKKDKHDLVKTTVKDLRDGFGGEDSVRDKEFLNKYMTLTRCDLFFADKAILIEGPTERLLMSKMIAKVDSTSETRNLSSQYVSVLEVGGAYAHHFYRLLDFLELPSLIITDLDTVKERKKCKVSEGERTSNESIKEWFSDSHISPQQLLEKSYGEKLIKNRRIAYEVPETGSDACGPSFEDAFMLVNPTLFAIEGDNDMERAADAYTKAQDVHKTDFALKYGIEQTDWEVPRYIHEGLVWLANVGAEAHGQENEDSHVENEADETTLNQVEA